MDFEKILPIIIIWAIWRIVTSLKKTAGPVDRPAPETPGNGLISFRPEDISDTQITEIEYTESQPARPFSEAGKEVLAKKVHYTEKKTMQPNKHRDHHRYGGSSRNFLQNAVIWAEILAPPIGLRDKSGNKLE